MKKKLTFVSAKRSYTLPKLSFNPDNYFPTAAWWCDNQLDRFMQLLGLLSKLRPTFSEKTPETEKKTGFMSWNAHPHITLMKQRSRETILKWTQYNIGVQVYVFIMKRQQATNTVRASFDQFQPHLENLHRFFLDRVYVLSDCPKRST